MSPDGRIFVCEEYVHAEILGVKRDVVKLLVGCQKGGAATEATTLEMEAAGIGLPSTNLHRQLSDHLRQLRLRVRVGNLEEAAVACVSAVRSKSHGELDLHADSVRAAESAAGLSGHSARAGNDHLDDGGDLAALPVGRSGAGAVFGLGVAGDSAATVDHGDELVRPERS